MKRVMSDGGRRYARRQCRAALRQRRWESEAVETYLRPRNPRPRRAWGKMAQEGRR